jgi:hypothetical protein
MNATATNSSTTSRIMDWLKTSSFLNINQPL